MTQELIENQSLIAVASNLAYAASIIGAISLPIWGYALLEKRMGIKHSELKVTRKNKKINSSAIIASLGTTTTGVFTIQILPLLFKIINDVGGGFGIDTMYADHFASSGGQSQFAYDFYGLTAQLADMLQEVAPLAAVGLGGYNLINNMSRGLPA